jgi:hypothetical protein
MVFFRHGHGNNGSSKQRVMGVGLWKKCKMGGSQGKKCKMGGSKIPVTRKILE